MVVSITVFDEAPTKVTLSTLLKSSVPWGVAMGIVSTIWGGFLNWGKPEGFRLFDTGALGTWVLAKWDTLWRKLFIEGRRAKRGSLDLLRVKEGREEPGGTLSIHRSFLAKEECLEQEPNHTLRDVCSAWCGVL